MVCRLGSLAESGTARWQLMADLKILAYSFGHLLGALFVGSGVLLEDEVLRE